MPVEFGTYHHSTPKQSGEMRKKIGEEFSLLLPTLFDTDSNLRILDAGCGLGFLSYVCAITFPKSQVTGIDIFNSGSLSEESITKAVENMNLLGIGSRVHFVEHDLTTPIETEDEYDLVVSNLVFHNLGRSRFRGYEHVFNVLKGNGYFVIGDLFLHESSDSKYLTMWSSIVKEIQEDDSGRWRYKIKVLKKA